MAKGDTPNGTAEAPAGPITRDQAVRQGYSTAQKQIREENLDRFHELQIAAIAALGFEWSPRPDEKAKAREQIAALLDQHPDLLDEFIPEDRGEPETPTGAPPGGEPLAPDTVIEKGL